jgi:hypothetical protein
VVAVSGVLEQAASRATVARAAAIFICIAL